MSNGTAVLNHKTPTQELFATGTPSELRVLNHDLRRVKSCAIPAPGIEGCPHALECAQRMFGLEEEGGFGPSSTEPGAPGQGPKYVGYYLETQEGDAKEDIIRCSAFMQTMFGRYTDQEKTGETILVVAQEGEEITILETVSAEPGSLKNLKQVQTEKTIVVPAHPRPADIDRRSRLRDNAKRALRERRRARRVARAGFDPIDNDDPQGNPQGDGTGAASGVSSNDGRPVARPVKGARRVAGGSGGESNA